MDPRQMLLAVRIMDGLFLGNCISSQDDEFLFSNKVTRVVNCAGTETPNIFIDHGIDYLSFAWRDSPKTMILDSQDRNIIRITKFIDDAFERGECVLVHSLLGISRCSVVAAAYLIFKYGWTLENTLRFIHVAHPDMEIQDYFIKQLMTFSQRKQRDHEDFTKRRPPPSIDSPCIKKEKTLLQNTYINSLPLTLEDIKMLENQRDQSVKRPYQRRLNFSAKLTETAALNSISLTSRLPQPTHPSKGILKIRTQNDAPQQNMDNGSKDGISPVNNQMEALSLRTDTLPRSSGVSNAENGTYGNTKGMFQTEPPSVNRGKITKLDHNDSILFRETTGSNRNNTEVKNSDKEDERTYRGDRHPHTNPPSTIPDNGNFRSNVHAKSGWTSQERYSSGDNSRLLSSARLRDSAALKKRRPSPPIRRTVSPQQQQQQQQRYRPSSAEIRSLKNGDASYRENIAASTEYFSLSQRISGRNRPTGTQVPISNLFDQPKSAPNRSGELSISYNPNYGNGLVPSRTDSGLIREIPESSAVRSSFSGYSYMLPPSNSSASHIRERPRSAGSSLLMSYSASFNGSGNGGRNRRSADQNPVNLSSSTRRSNSPMTTNSGLHTSPSQKVQNRSDRLFIRSAEKNSQLRSPSRVPQYGVRITQPDKDTDKRSRRKRPSSAPVSNVSSLSLAGSSSAFLPSRSRSSSISSNDADPRMTTLSSIYDGSQSPTKRKRKKKSKKKVIESRLMRPTQSFLQKRK